MTVSLTDKVFIGALAIGVVAVVVLIRRGGQALSDAAGAVGTAVGEGARSLSDVTLTIPNIVTRGAVDVARAPAVNQRDPTVAVPDDDTFGGNLFKLRVALFGVPDDFSKAARDANPGLIGQLFN